MMKNIREHLGMTQFEFCILMQVSMSTVAKWESSGGNPKLSIDQLRIIKNAIGPEKQIEDFL